MVFKIEIEQEEDGRWMAEVIELPGALSYGQTPEEARAKAQAVALRIVADRLEHGEAGPELPTSPLRLHESLAQHEGQASSCRSPMNRLGGQAASWFPSVVGPQWMARLSVCISR